ncbi:MAG TPA: hypothetical protein VNQ80_15400 [Parapedobacter sp.]|uniref:hypothetical protein n=1 Tax=Parapedobacter sp. TaxID=1958893 RepID=UPI002B837A74|nr:hypothetical protein [Parapedobacter sp.]HWK58728.1 hypothetical protein [Parapedobacter sp.]
MAVKFSLPADLAGSYEVVNTTSPILESRIGRIDFRRLTKEKAEALIKAGTRYLRKIEKKPSTAKDKE